MMETRIEFSDELWQPVVMKEATGYDCWLAEVENEERPEYNMRLYAIPVSDDGKPFYVLAGTRGGLGVNIQAYAKCVERVLIEHETQLSDNGQPVRWKTTFVIGDRVFVGEKIL